MNKLPTEIISYIRAYTHNSLKHTNLGLYNDIRDKKNFKMYHDTNEFKKKMFTILISSFSLSSCLLAETYKRDECLTDKSYCIYMLLYFPYHIYNKDADSIKTIVDVINSKKKIYEKEVPRKIANCDYTISRLNDLDKITPRQRAVIEKNERQRLILIRCKRAMESVPEFKYQVRIS